MSALHLNEDLKTSSTFRNCYCQKPRLSWLSLATPRGTWQGTPLLPQPSRYKRDLNWNCAEPEVISKAQVECSWVRPSSSQAASTRRVSMKKHELAYVLQNTCAEMSFFMLVFIHCSYTVKNSSTLPSLSSGECNRRFLCNFLLRIPCHSHWQWSVGSYCSHLAFKLSLAGIM